MSEERASFRADEGPAEEKASVLYSSLEHENEPRVTNKLELVDYLFLVVLVGINFVVSILYIQSPGLAPDETYFCNAAMGSPLPGFFIFRDLELFGWHLPIMSQGHIGLAKALIYLPVFALMPPGAMSIRLPTIIMGLLTVILTYLLARRMFGRVVACLAAILFASDPNTLANFRMDWGPSAIAGLCRVSCLYFLVRSRQSGSSWNLFFAGLFAGLGLWDKLDFAWFLFALTTAFLFDRRAQAVSILKTVLAVLRKQKDHAGIVKTGKLPGSVKKWGAFTAGVATGGLPFWMHNFPVPFSVLLALREPKALIPFAQKLKVLTATLDGSGWYEMINGKPPFWPPGYSWGGEMLAQTPALERSLSGITPSPHTLFPFVCLIGLLLLLYFVFRPSGRPFEDRCFRSLSVLAAVLFAEILLTRQSYGPHHFFHLYPLLQILAAYSFVRAWQTARAGILKLPVRIAIGLFMVLCVASNYRADYYYVDEYRKFGGRGIWSDASYALADYITAHKTSFFAFFDYGLMHQIIPLTNGQVRGKEYVFQMLEDVVDKPEDVELNELCRRKDVIFVTHTKEASQLNQPMKHLDRYLEANGMQAREICRFNQKDGLPIIILFKAVPKSED